MKRRNFLKLAAASPMGIAALGTTEAKPRQKPLWHACSCWLPNMHYSKVFCRCGHEIQPHWTAQNETILGCSECGLQFQLHVVPRMQFADKDENHD